MSREQSSRPNFGSSTGSSGRGGRNKPNNANSRSSHGERRGQRGTTARPAHAALPKADIKEGLDMARVIKTMAQPTRPSAPEDFPIENVKYITSYNWIDEEKPTIAVPGSPAIWTGRAVPFKLGPDDSTVFVDQNSARLLGYPMLPLFAAADEIHGHKTAPVDWPKVDVITDRNGLRKLLRWLSPGKWVPGFRIDVQLVGTKTLVFSRWENCAREPASGHSHGFRFEQAMTRPAPGCPSSGHHRTITYDMLDMKMLVQFEVDACLPTSTGSSDQNTRTASVDELADVLDGMSIKHRTSAAIKTTSSSSSPIINIVRAGTQVPQEALVKVVSRPANSLNKLKWNELYPQLALSQTPTLHLGVHERDVFTQVHEWQLDGRPRAGTRTGSATAGTTAPDISAQRRETAVQIVRLAKLLEDVQELAITRGPGAAGSFSLVCERGELRVYAHKKDAGAKSCLPPDVMARFEVCTQIAPSA